MNLRSPYEVDLWKDHFIQGLHPYVLQRNIFGASPAGHHGQSPNVCAVTENSSVSVGEVFVMSLGALPNHGLGSVIAVPTIRR